MMTIRSLIAGLMATLLAVISVATFLLVYFASLDSVESLTTLSVETASDRIAGQISTTLLDRVTNPLVAVARAARVRGFTAPADDQFAQNATSPDRFAWHGEWRTLFDDIVSGCPGCIMQMRFIDGSFGVSFPVPNERYRFHQFTRSYNGTVATGTEDFYDHITYNLTLQTFDEATIGGIPQYKPSTATRVGSTFWTSVFNRIQGQNLGLPSRFPGVWTGADTVPNINIAPYTTIPNQACLRSDVIISNVTMNIALITVYLPLADVMQSAEASLPTPNSRVFAVNDIGVVTEVGRKQLILDEVRVDRCSDPATVGCLPRISDMAYEPLTIVTNDPSFFQSCPALNEASYPVPSDGSTSRAPRTSIKLKDNDGNIYFASPRCVDTPFSLSRLRVVTIIPQDDINQDLTHGRDVSIAIVVTFFIIALVFGYLFVWYLLKPFEIIAQRMKKAALLADNEPKQDSSCLEEIARLQHAYETMNEELLRLKGFVPQSVLQLDMLDESSSQRSGSYEKGDAGSPEGEGGVEMRDKPPREKASVLFRRAHIMAERLSVSVSSIQRNHVTVCVINLRNFHGAIAELSTEDLSKAVEQIVRIVSDVTADNRGVVDFFHGDHYVLTYNAARLCHSPTKSAIATCLKVTDALLADNFISGMQRLGITYQTHLQGQYNNKAASDAKANTQTASAAAAGGENGETKTGDENLENEVMSPAEAMQPSGNNNANANNTAENSAFDAALGGSPPPRLIVSAGVAAGEATVGSFGSSELKRFCTIGPCYSQAFEIELLLKDAPQLRRSSNTLPHSIGVPHWMLNHVFRQYTLEVVAAGSISNQKTGIARVVAPVSQMAAYEVQQQLHGMHSATPREGEESPSGMKPIPGAPALSSKECLEAFVDICLAEESGATDRILSSLRRSDGNGANLLNAIFTQAQGSENEDVPGSGAGGTGEEGGEDDVLNEAFATQEDWADDGNTSSGTDTETDVSEDDKN